MCGWAGDNGRCSWNSQTGCKIASRMQRKRREPSVLHNETLASCLLGLSELWGGWLGASFSRSPRRDQGMRVRVCWAEHGSSRGFLSRWSVGHSRSVAFHRVWRDQRQPRDVLLPSCALVPGMEKKSGSEPRGNGEQPPRSLPCPPSVWRGGDRNTRAVFASSLEGGGRPWEGLGSKGRNGRFGRPEWLEVEFSHGERGLVSGQNSASWEPRVEPQGPVTGSPSRAATKELKFSLCKLPVHTSSFCDPQ